METYESLLLEFPPLSSFTVLEKVACFARMRIGCIYIQGYGGVIGSAKSELVEENYLQALRMIGQGGQGSSDNIFGTPSPWNL